MNFENKKPVKTKKITNTYVVTVETMETEEEYHSFTVSVSNTNIIDVSKADGQKKTIEERLLKKYEDAGWVRGKLPTSEEILTKIVMSLEILAKQRNRDFYEKVAYFKEFFKETWHKDDEENYDSYAGYKINYYDSDGVKYIVKPVFTDAEVELITNAKVYQE